VSIFFLFTIYSLGLLFFSLFRILDGTIIFDETDTIDLSVLYFWLQKALTINQVPGRNFAHTASWEAIAWPSKRPLKGWFMDTLKRIEQLHGWTENLRRPQSTW
jgi:hypothetical protein